MIRLLLMLIGVFCFSVVVAEACLIALVWSRGNLTPANIRDVRQILAGQQAITVEAEETLAQQEQESLAQIREARLVRVLDLETRARELELLKIMTSETANELISERQAFDEKKEAFQQELTNLQTQLDDAAIRQARAVLLASQPEQAALRLMGLPAEEAVRLLSGMPEKSIAKILQAFQKDIRMAPRGQELFEALARGGEKGALLKQAMKDLESNPESAGALN